MTLSYTCLTLSYKLKLIFERQEIVLLMAGVEGGFAWHGQSGMEAGGGLAERGLPEQRLGRERRRENDAQPVNRFLCQISLMKSSRSTLEK
ncbi:hypothetical protein E2C01_099281 [Portunus trituberculatus]|uniref:Uncharacterized protein n=1 Tax=Portunus trituberculatus TaxID=210409 RepID=A0A5B7KF17_PORTR|nr:hypothetical protein [Portunus trituberculatus]